MASQRSGECPERAAESKGTRRTIQAKAQRYMFGAGGELDSDGNNTEADRSLRVVVAAKVL